MAHFDGFQTTNSFRFDRNRSTSTMSLSSSSGYGSRSSLLSHRRLGFTRYFKEKLSKHKSFASLLLSSNTNRDQIYEHVWNLDEQIERFRLKFSEQSIAEDLQSMISMSVDDPDQLYDSIDDDDDELLRAAPWFQEGLPRQICEEYLSGNEKPIGSFILRRSYTYRKYPFVLSIRTQLSLVEHFLIERIEEYGTYRLQNSSKQYENLSTLVVHHTVLKDVLPVSLRLPINDSTSSSIRSVRF